MRRNLGTLAAVALGLSALTTRAQTTFVGLDDPRYTLTNSMQAETTFQAALIKFGTETLDNPGFSSGLPLNFGTTGVTAVTQFIFVGNEPFAAVSTPNFLFTTLLDELITFSQPVNAFGTYLIGLGTTPIANSPSFVLENTVLGTRKTVNIGTFGPNASNLNVAYFGVIDVASPFDRVTVLTSNLSNSFLFDNLTAGFAIPEPGSLALLAGLSAMGLLAGRRRHRS